MTGRHVEKDEWENHKDEIHRLFITKDRKISDVIELMTLLHGFTRTYVEEPYSPSIRYDYN